MSYAVHAPQASGGNDMVIARFATQSSAESFASSEHDRTHQDYSVEYPTAVAL